MGETKWREWSEFYAMRCGVAGVRRLPGDAQVSAGNVVHLGEPADDRVLFGQDSAHRVELCLQNGKIVLEARHLVGGIVQSLATFASARGLTHPARAARQPAAVTRERRDISDWRRTVDQWV